MFPILNNLRQSLPYRTLEERGPIRGYIKAPKPDHTPVRITGGIGDLILGLALAEALYEKVGDVVVYSKWPGISKIFSPLPARNEAEIMKTGFEFIITVNSLAQFQFAKNFSGFENQELEQVLIAHKMFRRSWESILESHPIMDNLLARQAVKMGFNRETIGFESLGLEFKQLKYRPSRIFSNHLIGKIIKGPYITVHDGFDENHNITTRSMKNWSLESWKALVEKIKNEFHVKIVQLGGPKSRHIKGVDIDLAGLVDFQESMLHLSSAVLHIDGDSGLVHANHVFRGTSLVMFGPTPADYFGYKNNINIGPKYCGDCWWLKKDWMTKCPAGYIAPECMDSITVDEVFDKIQERFG